MILLQRKLSYGGMATFNFNKNQNLAFSEKKLTYKLHKLAQTIKYAQVQRKSATTLLYFKKKKWGRVRPNKKIWRAKTMSQVTLNVKEKQQLQSQITY